MMVQGKWNLQKIGKMAVTIILAFVIVIFLLSTLGMVVHAAGLVDDTVSPANEYSKYPLDNYQLDFYVDTGWDWLPWNWLDGIGKQVMYGLYAITNFVWTINLYISNATGYLVQEAYSLDFISATADSIGKNMQTIAGISASGLSSEGFYVGFLLILILIVGIYVTYVGLIKRETTKAIHAVMNFVVVFVLSAAFIAYAPDYIGKINDFSTDISNASLSLGTKIVLPDSESKGKDSVDLIRDSLFAIQVKQPWLLLQFGNSDSEAIGADRAENLLSTSPDMDNGKDREEIVKAEIEDRENTNLTVTKAINRLGTVFFLFLFTIGISIFVFLLTGIMIFSQVLFIIYAMFLPVSFLLSMVPTFEGMSKRAVTKLFNTILTRAGITLIITAAFSISTMLYSLSSGYPFFLIAFLQIVTFAGIYFKLGDLMSMFSLQSGDSQNIGKQIMRKPRMLMHAHMHHLQHKLGRSLSALGSQNTGKTATSSVSGTSRTTHTGYSRPDGQTVQKDSIGKRAGQTVGTVTDTKDRIVDTVGQLKEQAKDLPLHARYALYYGKTQVSKGVSDFTSGIAQARSAGAEGRKKNAEQRRKTIVQRRAEMEQEKQQKQAIVEQKTPAVPVHERPAAPVQQEKLPVESRQAQTERSMVQTIPAEIPTKRPTVSSVKEQTEQPGKTEKQVVKAEMPPVRVERRIVKTASTLEHRPVKERSTVIKRESVRREKFRTATTTPIVQKDKGAKK